MNNDLYHAYVGIQVFTLRDVACLLVGTEQITKENKRRVSAMYGQLRDDAEKGLLPCKRAGTYERTPWLEDMGRGTRFITDWPNSKVTRWDLMLWCKDRGLAPEFLVPPQAVNTSTVDTDTRQEDTPAQSKAATVPAPPKTTCTDTANTGILEQAPKKTAHKPTTQALEFARFLAHVVKYGDYTPEQLPFNSVTLRSVFNDTVDKKFHVDVKCMTGFINRNRTLLCEILGVPDIAFSKNTQNQNTESIKNILAKNPFIPTG